MVNLEHVFLMSASPRSLGGGGGPRLDQLQDPLTMISVSQTRVRGITRSIETKAVRACKIGDCLVYFRHRIVPISEENIETQLIEIILDLLP